jgi:3-oxoacyl-[acyl-carrier protein] reductase
MKSIMENKIALVVAASQGLGKAAAMAIARKGATVVICSRRKNAIVRAADEIHEETGSTIVPFVADVSSAGDIKRLVAFTKRKFGTVHILVNNAGGPPTGDILSMTDAEWKSGFELTLMSVVRLTRAVLPMMIEQKWGRIITITSIAGKQPINDLLISSTLRPGIHGLTKVLSNKYARYNITVNSVCPGNILSSRQEELIKERSAKRKISTAEYLAEVTKDIPAGRLGTPQEIGEVIAFLATDEASYINGANLLVDGGMAKGIH